MIDLEKCPDCLGVGYLEPYFCCDEHGWIEDMCMKCMGEGTVPCAYCGEPLFEGEDTFCSICLDEIDKEEIAKELHNAGIDRVIGDFYQR